MMPAGIGAAADLDAQLLDFRVGVIVQLARKHVGQRERARDSQIARGGSRAPGDVRNGARTGRDQVKCAKFVVDRANAVKGNPRNDEVLIDGDAHAGQFVLFQNVRETAHLAAVQRSGGKFDPHRAVSGLALGHQVVLRPAVVFGIGLRFRSGGRQRRRRDSDQ